VRRRLGVTGFDEQRGDTLKKFLWVILVGLCVASCDPAESLNPLSDPRKAKTDTRLAGVWKGTGDMEEIYLHMIAKGSSSMEVVVVSHDALGKFQMIPYEMFTTTLAGKHYMNLKNAAQAKFDHNKIRMKLGKQYVFTRYEFSQGGNLHLWWMDEEPVAEAIGAGKLRGKVLEGEDGKHAIITASTKKLAKFVQKADHTKLFPKFGSFIRMNAKGKKPPAAKKKK